MPRDFIPQAYLRHSRKNNNPRFEPFGLGGFPIHINNNELLDNISKVALKINEGNNFSEPVGKYKFKMYYGDLDHLINDFANYRVITSIRNPISRLLSNFGMFNDKNQLNRLAQYSVLNENIMNLNQFLENFEKKINHHWYPYSHLIKPFLSFKKISVLTTNKLNDKWEEIKNEYKLNDIKHIYKGNNSKIFPDKIYSQYINKITKYYAQDIELYNQFNDK